MPSWSSSLASSVGDTFTTSTRKTGPHAEYDALSFRPFVCSVRTSGSPTIPVASGASTTTMTTPATIANEVRRGSEKRPTAAKISAESMITSGGPRPTINGIAQRQPRPAPIRSAK